MAANQDLLTITTPTFERVIRNATLTRITSNLVGRKRDDLIASVGYPGSRNMVARRSQSGYICIQHSSFHPRAPKRTLLSLNVDRDEDRFFEDGTIIRAGNKAKEDDTCHSYYVMTGAASFLRLSQVLYRRRRAISRLRPHLLQMLSELMNLMKMARITRQQKREESRHSRTNVISFWCRFNRLRTILTMKK